MDWFRILIPSQLSRPRDFHSLETSRSQTALHLYTQIVLPRFPYASITRQIASSNLPPAALSTFVASALLIENSSIFACSSASLYKRNRSTTHEPLDILLLYRLLSPLNTGHDRFLLCLFCPNTTFLDGEDVQFEFMFQVRSAV